MAENIRPLPTLHTDLTGLIAPSAIMVICYKAGVPGVETSIVVGHCLTRGTSLAPNAAWPWR